MDPDYVWKGGGASNTPIQHEGRTHWTHYGIMEQVVWQEGLKHTPHSMKGHMDPVVISVLKVDLLGLKLPLCLWKGHMDSDYGGKVEGLKYWLFYEGTHGPRLYMFGRWS